MNARQQYEALRWIERLSDAGFRIDIRPHPLSTSIRICSHRYSRIQNHESWLLSGGAEGLGKDFANAAESAKTSLTAVFRKKQAARLSASGTNPPIGMADRDAR
jgi:hypothetical protein